MRVVTLNIWNRMGPWEQRLPGIRAGLVAADAHVVGLQEVVSIDGFRQAEQIAEGLGYHLTEGRHRESIMPMGNAILSRFPIRRSEVYELPTGGTNERRTLLHAELDAPFGRVPVFVTHLNWKLDEGHVRELQVRFIAETIARVCPPGASFCPILMGDFNAEPDADEMRFLRGLTSLGGATRTYFADAWVYGGEGQGATFARRNPFAAVGHEPDRRIDYIYVRGPDEQGRGEPLVARLVFDREHEGVFPSDHFGVMATLMT